MTSVRKASLLVLMLSAPGLAVAQSPLPPDPAEQPGSRKIGPVSLTPRIELRGVGVDSNVFNEAQDPKEDFTATIRPTLDAVMRFGVGRLVYRSTLDAVYFARHKSERALNRFGELRAEARMSNFVPFVAVGGLDTSDRPNTEIDVRADRTVRSLTAGAAVALLPTTAVVATVQRHTFAFSPGQRIQDVDLGEQLNNRRESYDIGVRYALTPLTTVVATYGREQAHFTLSPDRDSESIRVTSRFEFASTALVGGTASVGYRKFTPVNPALAPFEGLVAQVSARYASETRTLLGVQFLRDVEYSFEEEQPYYLTTGGTFTVTQRIAGPVDAQIVVGRERLQYERLAGVLDEAPAGTDTTTTAAAGLGYWVRQSARFGISLEFTRRDAHRPGRSYERRRILSSLTYGF